MSTHRHKQTHRQSIGWFFVNRPIFLELSQVTLVPKIISIRTVVAVPVTDQMPGLSSKKQHWALKD